MPDGRVVEELLRSVVVVGRARADRALGETVATAGLCPTAVANVVDNPLAEVVARTEEEDNGSVVDAL